MTLGNSVRVDSKDKIRIKQLNIFKYILQALKLSYIIMVAMFAMYLKCI
jgi:hypothetical protein